MGRKTRFFLLACLVVALVPGTWLRTALPEPDFSPRLALQPLLLTQTMAGEATIAGAWRLTSPNTHFGSYSALVALPGGQLLAASDKGRFLQFAQPGGTGATRFGWLAGNDTTRKKLIDIEAMARDPESGRLWFAYEGTNTIERRNARFGEARSVRPKPMAGFSSNSGPEAFTRLADGRFVVIAEGVPDWAGNRHPAFLFDDDPVESEAGFAFFFDPPTGYSPVDMVQIPDGRVLILVRRVAWGIPPTFPVKIVVADPADIAEDKVWSGTEVAQIVDPLPSDNFEGLAVVPQRDGTLSLWLISDDNGSALQRSLLLELIWDPRGPQAKEKARSQAARRDLSGD